MREVTAQAARRRCPPAWRVGLRCLAVAATLLLSVAAWAEEDDAKWSRPEAEQAGVRWDLLGGYWSDEQGNEIVMTTQAGILDAVRWREDDISILVGPWRVIRRLRTGPYYREAIAVVSREQWCSSFGKPMPEGPNHDETHAKYRDVRVRQRFDRDDWLEADISLDIHPPPDALTADIGPMWREFRDNIPDGGGKSEGPWRRIREDEVPQWFRDLAAQDLIANPRCQP